MRIGGNQTETTAVGLTISEEFLNDLAAAGIGDGIDMGTTTQTFGLPMMGDVELTVSLAITKVTFVMSDDHPDSLLATIRAKGELIVGGDVPMPAFPGPVRVRGDVRVKPVIEYGRKQSLTAILDVSGSELVSSSLEGIDGLPADAEAQLQMSQMMFAAVGGDLFMDLAADLGHVGIEKRAGQVPQLSAMGAAPGAAEISIGDGEMWVGFPAKEGVVGTATPIDIHPGECGVSFASSAVGAAVNIAASLSLGMEAPVDHELQSNDGAMTGRVRNRRLVDSDVLPDFRPGLCYSVEPRIVGEVIEVKLSEAWIELPLVPSFVNKLSRAVGGAIAAAPISTALPTSFPIPTGPDGDGEATVSVLELSPTANGLDLTLSLHS